VAENEAGPICPHCNMRLIDTLHHRRLEAPSAREHESSQAVMVAFCGSCGWILTSAFAGGFEPALGDEAMAPKDADSLAGQFQLRCKELICEIQMLGLEPLGWIGLINRVGALEAAKELLKTRRILPVTRILVEKGRPELTMENEISLRRWSDLFDDGERAEAQRRLKSVGR
jgi:hypothetical protein